MTAEPGINCPARCANDYAYARRGIAGARFKAPTARRITARAANAEQSEVFVLLQVESGRRCGPTLSCSAPDGRVYSKYTMPTSVHIPKPLLVAVDRKARALKISRNRLIIQALEREVTEGSNWSPDFFGRLESTETGVEDAAVEMLKAIQSQRRSKKPVRL